MPKRRCLLYGRYLLVFSSLTIPITSCWSPLLGITELNCMFNIVLEELQLKAPRFALLLARVLWRKVLLVSNCCWSYACSWNLETSAQNPVEYLLMLPSCAILWRSPFVEQAISIPLLQFAFLSKPCTEQQCPRQPSPVISQRQSPQHGKARDVPEATLLSHSHAFQPPQPERSSLSFCSGPQRGLPLP